MAASGAFLFGGVADGGDVPPPARVSPIAVAEASASGFASFDTEKLVADLEARLGARPDDVKAKTLLGLALHQRSRETGEPEYYPRAERALRAALRTSPRNAEALLGLAGVAASRHRFDEALAFAKRALAERPDWAAAFGIVGDANLELGRYQAAFAAFDRQAALRPSASAYARVSYARELLGDFQGAVDAMRLAVYSAAPQGEPAAWARVNLGNLFLGRGKLGAAESWYRKARLFVPGYPPALAGLGQVAETRGKLTAATALYKRAARGGAVPEYAVLLGDVLAKRGMARGSEAAYARAADLERRFAAAGGNNKLETAMFDLDHDRNVGEALNRAREGRTVRPSIEGDHVLAWALYKNGRCAEARAASVRHLRLGTPDLDGLYHRSLIERCLGNAAAAAEYRARVRALDPYYLAAPPSARQFPPPA